MDEGEISMSQRACLLKEQSETLADVWIYCEQGWPGQGGNKWRHSISVMPEILYP